MKTSLRSHIESRFAEFYDRLSEDEKEMWYGWEAIYSRAEAIKDALEQLSDEGINSVAEARKFDVEALWE